MKTNPHNRSETLVYPSMHQAPLPTPDQTIGRQYQHLVSELDDAIGQLIGHRFTNRLQCGPGCSSCCTGFSILALEASFLFQALSSAPSSMTGNGNRCQLLVDERCSVYARRPIICRTQGLPIAYLHEDGTALEVSACPLNFADDYSFVHEELLFLDHYNNRLAELNRRYCRKKGIDPQLRIPIEVLVRMFCSS